MTVSYANVKYNTYKNINTEIENIIALGDTFTFKVTNSNDNAVKLTTKIEGSTDQETICDNTVMVEKGAQEITVNVAETDANKTYTPKKLVFFLDSGWNETEDTTERSGKLTFSEFTLTKAGGGDEPEIPEVPSIPDGWAALDISTFWGEANYDIDTTGPIVISHTELRDSYQNCGANIDLKGATKVKVIVWNGHATEDAHVKVDIQDSSITGGSSSILSAAAFDGEAVSYVEWGALGVIPAGESKQMLEAGGDAKLNTIGKWDGLHKGSEINENIAYAKQAAKNVLYTVANSAGMNGFVHGMRYRAGFAYSREMY